MKLLTFKWANCEGMTSYRVGDDFDLSLWIFQAHTQPRDVAVPIPCVDEEVWVRPSQIAAYEVRPA